MNKPWDTFPSLRNPLEPRASQSQSIDDGKAAEKSPLNRIAVIGAGLAGCWLARILAEKGIAVTLYDKQLSVASAASGNPAGIAKPFVTRDASLAMSFHCIAHKLLLNKLEQLNLEASAEFAACGVLQLVEKPFPASDNFVGLSALEASDIAGASLNNPALNFSNGGWLNPKQLCCQLVTHPLITVELGKEVIGVGDSATQRQDNSEFGPRTSNSYTNLSPNETEPESGTRSTRKLDFKDGKPEYAEHIVFTTGAATHLLPDIHHLPITAARGQISRFALSENSVAPNCVVSGKHYVIPDGDSLLVGASFQRDNTDADVSDLDHEANLEGLRQLLPTLKVNPQATAGYVGVRATTPDRLPIVGPLPDFAAAAEIYGDIKHGRTLADYLPLPCRTGIYVVGGLGSRGIVTAPLCAQLLADHLTQGSKSHGSHLAPRNESANSNSAIDYGTLENWASLINPARFLIRNLKRST